MAQRQSIPVQFLTPAVDARYSSRIIKAGALLSDTKTLLSHWDTSGSVQANLSRIRQENTFGKASRSRVADILAIFRQRYLCEDGVIKALVALVRDRLPAHAVDRILYFHAAKSDPLLYDVVAEWLAPLQRDGNIDIDVGDVQRLLEIWAGERKTKGEWSEETTSRVAQGLLSTLRDFGVLQGAVHKRIAPAYVPVVAFAYVLFYMKQHQPSGAKLVEHSDWRLFFLPREGVERFLFEAHQQGLLEYHAAGSVTRLSFPVTTLEEYAHVLAQRAH
ncbi:MAG: BrxA family protein [Isosphaeraceae bacterium]